MTQAIHIEHVVSVKDDSRIDLFVTHPFRPNRMSRQAYRPITVTTITVFIITFVNRNSYYYNNN
jgi:hypothetical protein